MNTFPCFAYSESLPDTTPPAPRDVSRPELSTVNAGNNSQDPVSPRRSLRVLCIDDDEMVLESMNDVLAHFGHQVGVAPGGTRGIEMFRAALLQGAPYDVVITDMNMPDVGGYAVAGMIKAESSDTPVILMTGAGNTTRDGGPMSASVDTVVSKPVQMQELNDLLLQMARPAQVEK
ncbi:MAG TPA: response regulator [Candidatus Sulfopaludibacter sp.]|nr:response regulator [Candidatus Sulfopaludibacter sp.]